MATDEVMLPWILMAYVTMATHGVMLPWILMK